MLRTLASQIFLGVTARVESDRTGQAVVTARLLGTAPDSSVDLSGSYTVPVTGSYSVDSDNAYDWLFENRYAILEAVGA